MEGQRRTFVVALVVVGVACVVALIVPRRRAKGAPWVPIPSSSILAAGGGLFVGLGTSKWGAGFASLVTPIAVASALAITLTFAMHRPARIAALLCAADPDLSPSVARARAWRGMVLALPSTILFFAILTVADRVAHDALGSRRMEPLGETLPLVIAVALDVAFAVSAHRRVPDATPVWQERRSEAAFAMREGLAREGIDAEVRGVHVFALFQFFAPPMPLEIFVPAPQADRARAWIEEFLRRAAESRTSSAARHEKTDRTDFLGVARIVALGVGLVVVVASLRLQTRPHGVAHGIARDVRFELDFVDDALDPFEAASDMPLPLGGSIQSELAPIGLDAAGVVRSSTVHYLRIVVQPSETLEQLRVRAEAWARSVALPADRRWAWGLENDPTTHLPSKEALRSFVLAGEVILRNADVAGAEVMGAEVMGDENHRYDYYVAITLTESGAKRFADATEQWVKRRIAIVLDGTVNSAPVVQSKIAGGHVSITLGSDDDHEAQKKAALDLAESLDPRH
jgi:hypothetical protein